MDLIDQLGYEMLALLFDAPAPLSVVFPEARMFLPETRAVEVEQALGWLQAASERGWVTLTVDDQDGHAWPYRAPVGVHLDNIADEYRRGARDSDEIRQILDRPDLWLEISPAGKEAVKRVWPDMPSDATWR